MAKTLSRTPDYVAPPSALDITVRHPSFEHLLADLGRPFAKDQNIVASNFLAGLSAIFPPGEDFFVRSVRSFRSRISDPVLKKQVNAFIGQEAVHGREHRVLNDRLAELGYTVERLERMTTWWLGERTKRLPAMYNLAVTAAIEHYTAVLGELLLSNEELRELIGHQGLQTVFTWHAMEECEHKTVVFDVYRSVGGPEWLRKLAMNEITMVIMLGTVVDLTVSLLRDRKTRFNPRRIRREFNALRSSGLITMETWRKIRAYNEDGFHPNDFDTDQLVERFRVELFDEGGTLIEGVQAGAA